MKKVFRIIVVMSVLLACNAFAWPIDAAPAVGRANKNQDSLDIQAFKDIIHTNKFMIFYW